MKKCFVRVLAVATMLAPFIGRAELLVYKGSETENFIGENTTLRISWKMFVVVDRDTANFASVAYATINGSKRYDTHQYTNAHFVQVIGTRGKTYTAVAHIPNDCDAQERPGKEGIYLQGANSILTLNTNSTISFPRTLTDNGTGLSHSTSTGEPFVTSGIILLVFNAAQTLASNQASETLDIALARIVANVQSLGYAP